MLSRKKTEPRKVFIIAHDADIDLVDFEELTYGFRLGCVVVERWAVAADGRVTIRIMTPRQMYFIQFSPRGASATVDKKLVERYVWEKKLRRGIDGV